MLNFFGILVYVEALLIGRVVIVTTLSTLYPVIVVIVGVAFFNEKLTVKQTVGIGFDIAAIALIAT